MARILLVEDNPLNRDMLSRRLLRAGYELLVAEDGPQGLAMIQSERPDLVLMDMSLPGIDGWECTRRVKADPQLAAIPIVALTAHAMVGDRQRCLEAGCDAYDTKPIDFKRLRDTIEGLLTGLVAT